jgi:tight adherence protein C
VTVALALAWAAVVVAALGLARSGALMAAPRWPSGAVSRGTAYRRSMTQPRNTRPVGPRRRLPGRRARRALLIGLAGAALVPPVGILAAVPAIVVPELRARRRTRHGADTVLFELPEVVDLFRVGASAGLTITESARLLARRDDGPSARAFALAVRKIDRGARVADALDGVVTAGEPLRPLVRILVGVDRYGLPLEPGIGEVALLARAERRRRVETAARQVSIRLLVPLVVCVLPAFMLLTVVPSLLASFGRLEP